MILTTTNDLLDDVGFNSNAGVMSFMCSKFSPGKEKKKILFFAFLSLIS